MRLELEICQYHRVKVKVGFWEVHILCMSETSAKLRIFPKLTETFFIFQKSLLENNKVYKHQLFNQTLNIVLQDNVD